MKQIIAFLLCTVLFAGAATARCIPAQDAYTETVATLSQEPADFIPDFQLVPVLSMDQEAQEPEEAPPKDSWHTTFYQPRVKETNTWIKAYSKARWCESGDKL